MVGGSGLGVGLAGYILIVVCWPTPGISLPELEKCVIPQVNSNTNKDDDEDDGDDWTAFRGQNLQKNCFLRIQHVRQYIVQIIALTFLLCC